MLLHSNSYIFPWHLWSIFHIPFFLFFFFVDANAFFKDVLIFLHMIEIRLLIFVIFLMVNVRYKKIYSAFSFRILYIHMSFFCTFDTWLIPLFFYIDLFFVQNIIPFSMSEITNFYFFAYWHTSSFSFLLLQPLCVKLNFLLDV